ncbi:MAG: hypothetical protein M1834_009666 [Cirrosporium novae-zelandiae]|nr:MAG: hypothetical protein M1834_009666 [Cirrosporium novae-zelandiae]
MEDLSEPYSLSEQKHANRQPLSTQVNNTSLKRKTSGRGYSQSSFSNSELQNMRKSGTVLDSNRVSSHQRGGQARKNSKGEIVGSKDSYGHGSLRGAYPGQVAADEDIDDSDWIHRDKLARIENAELQQAGLQFPYQFGTRSHSSSISSAGVQVRSRSREQSNHVRDASEQSSNSSTQIPGRSRSREQYSHGGDATEQQDPRHYMREEKRQRLTSPVPDEELEQGIDPQDEGSPANYDPRTPEEIAADPYGTVTAHSSPNNQHGLRTSSSRLPLPKVSPVPIPQERLARNVPLPRKRTPSGTVADENGLAYNKTRSRSQSVNSQLLLDTDVANGYSISQNRPNQKTPSQNSPVKSKLPGKTTPGSNGRKTSTPASNSRNASTHRPRTASGQKGLGSQRPTTRGGERPPTAAKTNNKPEGDPPWLATMFKPDPRLPPDQQMLPTHAKRLQQEQWEKEGKPGAVYDRQFTPIAIADENGLHPVHPSNPSPEIKSEEEEKSTWPLKDGAKTSPTNGRPGTSGGYSTMPKVQKSPQIGSASSPKPIQSSLPPAVRIPEPPEELDQKKGGCCIVM